MRLAAAAALLLALPPALWALRPSDQVRNARSKAVWLTAHNTRKATGYYLEVSQDGRALLREEKEKFVITRRGEISVQLIKDFLRETESSELVSAKTGAKEDKIIFYDGEMLNVYAYISGELTVTAGPLNKFGEAFSYAFGEVRKEILKLPDDKAPAAFVRADPLEGDELEAFRAKAAKGGEVLPIETYDIQKIKPLMAAIKDAGRLIPLETAEDAKALQAFITDYKLLGLRTLFYLPSTRGTFKCTVLEADKRPPAGAKPAAPAKAAAKKKKARRAARP